jgi:hypothetical protein
MKNEINILSEKKIILGKGGMRGGSNIVHSRYR